THEIPEVLRTRLVANFPCSLSVDSHEIQRDLRIGLQINIGVVVMSAPDDGLGASHARNPDGWVRLLQWALKGIHYAKLVVFTLPAKRAGRCPGFNDEIVRLGKPLAVMSGVGVRRPTLDAGATHETGH